MKYAKIFIACAFTFFLIACNQVQPDKNPTFSGIEWGSEHNVVIRSLRENGFRPEKSFAKDGERNYDCKDVQYIGEFNCWVDKDGDITFVGNIGDYEVDGVVFMKNNQAHLVNVTVDPDIDKGGDNFVARFFALKKMLVGKYGEPQTTELPFDEDVKQIDALKAVFEDKDIFVIWSNFDERGGGLMLKMNGTTSSISYESKDYTKIVKAKSEQSKTAL